jgi:aryl-alcohol dehydrogenase-like predicted oxidoreductase
MMFGDRTDATEARRIVDDADAAGINFIDTADGLRQRRLREDRRRRDQGASATMDPRTKVGNPLTQKPHDGGLSRR